MYYKTGIWLVSGWLHNALDMSLYVAMSFFGNFFIYIFRFYLYQVLNFYLSWSKSNYWDCYKGQAVKKLNLHYITIKKPPFIYWYFWSHHSIKIDFQDTHPIIRKFPFKRACPFIRTNLIPINSSYLVPSLKLDHYSSPEVENEGGKYHG